MSRARKTPFSTLKEIKQIEQDIDTALEAIKSFEQSIKNHTRQLKKSLNLVKHQATHEFFTGFPNHILLTEQLNLAIQHAKQKKTHFAIIYFSLNEIEKVNHGLGHQASATAIRMIAERLKIFNHKNNLLSQLNYSIKFFHVHEFIILIESITDTKTIDSIAEEFFCVVDEPISLNQQLFKLTVSMGISLYPLHGQNMKTLLMNADAARLHARQHGGNKIEIYQDKINEGAFRKLEIESHLHVAIKNNELRLRYQPFIHLKTGRICGIEALTYWKNPILGFISPAEFIPLAEANGLIIPLGEWILRNACAQVKVWHEQGFSTLKLAVNLSAKQLQQKNIVQMITSILEEVNLLPEYLELELTETEIFKPESIPMIKSLKDIGLKLSIDDFGTGYSGLKNLKAFNVDKLKIDQAFIRDIEQNNYSKIIAENTIALAKKMNIRVLAEGVETKDQLNFLMDQNCDMVQGYYFSPPLSADELTELLINEAAKL